MTAAVIGPALPYFAGRTGALLHEVSILFSAGSGGYLAGSIIGGRWYDRLPGHRIAAAALLGIAVTLAISPLISLLWVLALVQLALGFAQGALDVGGNAMLVWVHGRRVGPYMNALHFFFGVGTFLAPVLVAQSVLRSGGIAWGFWVIAGGILSVALWVLTIPSPLPPARKQEKIENPDPLLLGLIVAFLFLYVGAEVGFGGWVYTYALELGLAGEVTGAYLTSAFWGAFTAGRLLSIPLAARLHPRWMLAGDLLGALGSLAVVVLFPTSIVLLWGGTILLGFSLASIFPTILTVTERRMTLSGATTSWLFVGSSLGAMFWPWLMGQFFDWVHPRAVMAVVLVDLALAFLLYILLMHLNRPLAGHGDGR